MSGKPGTKAPKGNVLLRLLGDERRQAFTIPLFSILCSLVAAAVVILLVGKNPLHAFTSLLQGAGILSKGTYAAYKSVLTDFLSTLDALTPMIFAALAVAMAYKAGLFNIGVSGQMLLAGYLATVTVGYAGLSSWLSKPLVLLVGILAGAAAGALIGALKHLFNINEVVSSIMLNYIFSYVTSYFINTRYVDPVTRQSRAVGSAARLTLTDVELGGLKTNLPVCIILAVLCALALRVLFNKTALGFEIKAVGANPKAAKYAGIRVGRCRVLAMTISGALAGLAGVTYYLGYFNSIQPKVLTNVGFDAIAVSLLGNSNPVGILFSSLLITVVDRGSTYMGSSVGVQQEIAQVITGLILLFSACGAYIRYRVARSRDKLEQAAGQAATQGGEG